MKHLGGHNMIFTKRFISLFGVQFLGALNDNIFKNAMVILITFRLSESAEVIGLLITLAAGLFILPFVLFSAIGGEIADKVNKTTLIRNLKFFELFIMIAAAFMFWYESTVGLFVVLFLMGTQSALFGPVKYSILPEYFVGSSLVSANAWFSGSTFVAILLGTTIGGFLILNTISLLWIASVVVTISIFGLVFSFYLPNSETKFKPNSVNINFFSTPVSILSFAYQLRTPFVALTLISWFWFVGAVFLSQVPYLVKEVLIINEQWVLYYLAVFTVGIAIGSAYSKYEHSNKFTLSTELEVKFLSSVLFVKGIMILGLILCLLFIPDQLLIIGIFLFLIAFFGARFIVPLYVLLQTLTDHSNRGKVFAANNIMNALFMVISSVLIMIGYSLSFNLITMFGILFFMNLFFYYLLKQKIPTLKR